MRKVFSFVLSIALIAGVMSTVLDVASADEAGAYESVLMEYKQAVRGANAVYASEGFDASCDRLFDWKPLSGVEATILGEVASLMPCFGYALRDINGDLLPELLLLTEEAHVLAVFTQTDSGEPRFFGMSAYDYPPDCIWSFLLPDDSLVTYVFGVEDGSIRVARLNDAGDSFTQTGGIGWRMTDRGDLIIYTRDESGSETRVPLTEYEPDEAFGVYEELSARYDDNRLKNRDIGYTPLFSPEEIAEIPVVPAPDTRFDEKVTLVNDQTVNIRSGPGTKYRQIGEAYPGASFYYTGKTKDGFLEIVYPNKSVIRVLAYVNEKLAEVSETGPEDIILSSVAGYLRVKPNTQVYYDAALSKKTKTKLGDDESVPFVGISSSGSYAVLYTTINKKNEQLLWIGYISPQNVVGESAPDE